MSYQLDYTWVETDEGTKNSINPAFFGYRRTDDNADEITVVTSDVYQIYIPDDSMLQQFNNGEFTYNEVTGEITFIGNDTFFDATGSATIGESSNPVAPNSIYHLAIFVNGVSKLESSCKIESSTGLASLSLTSFLDPFPIETGDIITIRVKSTQASGGKFNIYHIQGRMLEFKANLN